MTQFIFIGAAALLSVISMPIIIKFCKKFSLYDSQNARKIHSGDIPRLGGVGIAISFFIVAFLCVIFEKNIDLFSNLPLLIAALIIFVFGIVDDILELPAYVKLLVQLVAVSLVTFSGYRFTQIFAWKLPTILSFMLTFGWILGVINAYNLIDGLDALCGSLSFTALVSLGIILSIFKIPEAIICFILAGSIFGFLCFNWPPAKLFMGDGGSQFIGFMIATIPLYSTKGLSFEYNKLLIMIILASFPIFDTIAAIWRRLRDKRPIMSPDKMHLHHKFLNLGYTRKQTLFIILGIQILLCVCVVLSIFLEKFRGTAFLMEAFIFMCIFFGIMHYTNRAVLRKQSKEAEEKTNETEEK